MTKKRGRKPVAGVVRDQRLCLRFTNKEMELITNLSDYFDTPKTVFLRDLILSEIRRIDKELMEVLS